MASIVERPILPILKSPSNEYKKFKKRQGKKKHIQLKEDPERQVLNKEGARDQRERAKKMGNNKESIDVAFLSLGGKVTVLRDDRSFELYGKYTVNEEENEEEMIFLGSREIKDTKVAIFAYPGTHRYYVTYGDPLGRLVYVHTSSNPSQYRVGTDYIVPPTSGVKKLLESVGRSIPREIPMEVAYKDDNNIYFIVGNVDEGLRDAALMGSNEFFMAESKLIYGMYVKKGGVEYKFSPIERKGYEFKSFKDMTPDENRWLHGFIAADENALNLKTLPLYWKPEGQMENIKDMQRGISKSQDVDIRQKAKEGVNSLKGVRRNIQKPGPKISDYLYDGRRENLNSPSYRSEARAGKAQPARTMRQVEYDDAMQYKFTDKDDMALALFEAATDRESKGLKKELSELEMAYSDAFNALVSEGRIRQFKLILLTILEKADKDEQLFEEALSGLGTNLRLKEALEALRGLYRDAYKRFVSEGRISEFKSNLSSIIKEADDDELIFAELIFALKTSFRTLESELKKRSKIIAFYKAFRELESDLEKRTDTFNKIRIRPPPPSPPPSPRGRGRSFERQGFVSPMGRSERQGFVSPMGRRRPRLGRELSKSPIRDPRGETITDLVREMAQGGPNKLKLRL